VALAARESEQTQLAADELDREELAAGLEAAH
jgi:hypothetical protein